MLSEAAIVTLFAMISVTTPDFSRKDAKAQREMTAPFASLRLCGSATQPQKTSLPIDVFQILDLPLAVHEASLVKADRGYYLKLKIGNSSDSELVGLRYALVRIDSKNHPTPVAYRTEGFSLAAYESDTLTFKTPLKFKPNDERLVFMLEQVYSREMIWDVVKAKAALEAYVKSDFSVTPKVIRVANQVDAPMRPATQRLRY